MAGTEEMSFEIEAAYRKLCDFYYLTDGHLKDDDKLNSRRLKISVRKFKSYKQSLIDLGKFVVIDGYLKQDRAERELSHVYQISLKAREKAAKRWRKSSKNTAKPLKDNKTDDAGGYANSLTRKLERKKPPIVPHGDTAADFEEFWKAFPDGRKKAKGRAEKYYSKIVKSGTASPAELLDGAKQLAAAMGNDHEFVPMPSTWLNDKRWKDQDLDEPTGPANGRGGNARPSDTDLRRTIAGAIDDNLEAVGLDADGGDADLFSEDQGGGVD